MSLAQALTSRFAAIPTPVQGALLMLGAAFALALMNGLIREASATLHPLQIAFLRNFFALLVLLPWLMRIGFGGLRTNRLGLHVTRALVGFVAMVLWFSSVALLPLAEAVSLNFTVPLFATLGAALILGEVVRARRWTATIVGFLGVLVIVRPGMEEVTLVTMLPVLAAVFMAITVLMVKALSDSEDPTLMVFYMNLLLTPISLVPALFVWQWPDLMTLGIMMVIGVLAVVAHLMMYQSFARADASAVVPFQYAQLPFVALIGYFAFAELPDLWTLAGAVIIAASATYIARREAQIAKRDRAATHAAAERTFRNRNGL